MTNNKLTELYESLLAIKGYRGVKFNYAVAKNIGILEPEIRSFEKSIEILPDYSEYDKERVALAEKMAKKDELGKPILAGNKYDIENMAEFNEALKTIQETHKEAISNRDKQIEEYTHLMDAETKIELFKIEIDQIPEDITTEHMKAIYPLLQ